MAEKIAMQPLAALILSKKLLKTETAPLVSERLSMEGVEFVKRLQSPEAIEAFTAFMQKRKPNFEQF
jgi:enoyl-CoA hydratase/carnithine racemase